MKRSYRIFNKTFFKSFSVFSTSKYDYTCCFCFIKLVLINIFIYIFIYSFIFFFTLGVFLLHQTFIIPTKHELLWNLKACKRWHFTIFFFNLCPEIRDCNWMSRNNPGDPFMSMNRKCPLPKAQWLTITHRKPHVTIY